MRFSPTAAGSGPVEHLVHRRHSVSPHRRHVSSRHDGVIHPRVHRQLLLTANQTRLHAHGKATTRTNARVRERYLSEERLSRPRWAVHQDVPVQAAVLSRVPRRYGDVTHALL